MVDVNVTVRDAAGNAVSQKAVVNVATPTPPPAGGSFLPLLRMPGGQEVVVPNGTYTAGMLDAASTPGIKHPATNGPLKGFLVLRAETPGGVKIVASGPTAGGHVFELRNAERIAFIGIDTVDVVNRFYGCKSMYWWYGDSTYPVERHPDYPNNLALNGNTTPNAFVCGAANGRNLDLRWYGHDVHDCGDDGFRVKDTDGFWQGCRWESIAHHGKPNSPDQYHNDCIQTMGGSNLTVLDSYMRPIINEAGANAGCMWFAEANSGSITGRIERLWHHGPGWGKPLQFHRKDTAQPGSTVNVALKDVYAWGHAPTSPISRSGTGVTVTETNVVSGQPSGTDPATKWRNANAYGAWADVMGLA
jgi:hypothetical protein